MIARDEHLAVDFNSMCGWKIVRGKHDKFTICREDEPNKKSSIGQGVLLLS